MIFFMSDCCTTHFYVFSISNARSFHDAPVAWAILCWTFALLQDRWWVMRLHALVICFIAMNRSGWIPQELYRIPSTFVLSIITIVGVLTPIFARFLQNPWLHAGGPDRLTRYPICIAREDRRPHKYPWRHAYESKERTRNERKEGREVNQMKSWDGVIIDGGSNYCTLRWNRSAPLLLCAGFYTTQVSALSNRDQTTSNWCCVPPVHRYRVGLRA